MKLNKELILDIAKVSRLNLSDNEIKEFLPQLQEVLDAFDKLEELDTTNVEPSLHPVKINSSLREDKVIKTNISINGETEEKYFVGPKLK